MKQGKVQQNPQGSFQVIPVMIEACDGFTNPVAGLGAASPLTSSGFFLRSGLEYDFVRLMNAYEEDSVAKRIIDLVSEEMTRAWYALQADVEEEDLRTLKKLESKHGIRREMTDAIRWARLFGGSIAIMIIEGDEERMEEPLDPDRIPFGSFKGLLVMDRTQGINPSIELEDDLNDPEYGLPKYYDVDLDEGTGKARSVRIHHSRVLRFTGRELPNTEMKRNNYWGVSELQHIWDELIRYENTVANIERLTFSANLMTLKMGNMGSDLAYGSERMKENVKQTLHHENEIRTSYGVHVMSQGDSLETHPYNFAGLVEIKESMMMDIAGAAEIPATRLFGRSPQGMNATGESDQRNFCDTIAQQQERMLRPALEKLLPVMAASCWGYVPGEMEIVFNPLMTMTPRERAELSKADMAEITEAISLGLITAEEGKAELKARGAILGTWGSIH